MAFESRLPETIIVTKLDAVNRQLDTAIELWFADADPVSIHTLVSAAHEILDILYRKRGLNGLLFDIPQVREESRKAWRHRLQKEYNFFKHGRSDPDASTNFKPVANEFIIFFTIKGLQDMGETLSFLQTSFASWHMVNRPELLMEQARHHLQIIDVADLRSLSKQEFLYECEIAKYGRASLSRLLGETDGEVSEYRRSVE